MKPSAKTTNQIAITRSTSMSLAEKMRCLFDKARMRAYELFVQRGSDSGHDLDDWLQAENELCILPAAKIDESGRETRVRIDRADFTADESKVYVEPRPVTVEAASTKTTTADGLERSSERGWFGRYELPAAINTDLVRATLHNGVLEIVARKAEVGAAQPVQETGEPTSLKPNSDKEKSAPA